MESSGGWRDVGGRIAEIRTRNGIVVLEQLSGRLTVRINAKQQEAGAIELDVVNVLELRDLLIELVTPTAKPTRKQGANQPANEREQKKENDHASR